MAREYVKPIVAFEPLALNANASSACTVELSFAEFVCAVYIPEWGETIFTENNSDCMWTNDDGYICYHVPASSFTIFGS